jgi:hypothetical protein
MVVSYEHSSSERDAHLARALPPMLPARRPEPDSIATKPFEIAPGLCGHLQSIRLAANKSSLASVGWFTGTVRRWFALVGGVLTVASGVIFAATERRYWAWLTIVLLVLLVVALAWNSHDAHEELNELKERQPNNRAQLRPLLEAAEMRLEHLADTDSTGSPIWMLNELTEKSRTTYDLIDKSLGPAQAEEFSKAGGDFGPTGMQSELAEKATFVRGLLAKLDSLPIMGDWNPDHPTEPKSRGKSPFSHRENGL